MSIQRLPSWIRSQSRTTPAFNQVHGLMDSLRLNTVCEEAKCPNRHECWSSGTATVMILGEICTRSCAFCSVGSGRPPELDALEPRRVAAAAKEMGLKHIVVTSVNRDDQADGGAAIWAETIRELRGTVPGMTIEILTPDFEGNVAAMETVFAARPDVFGHNIETVRSLQSTIRPQASYGHSLDILRRASEWRPGMHVKSGLMVGLGESDDEVVDTMADLYAHGVRMLTIGQYLRPTRQHAEVRRFVPPETFGAYAAKAREIGFGAVMSGPMVRSSYKAETMFAEMNARDAAHA